MDVHYIILSYKFEVFQNKSLGGKFNQEICVCVSVCVYTYTFVCVCTHI